MRILFMTVVVALLLLNGIGNAAESADYPLPKASKEMAEALLQAETTQKQADAWQNDRERLLTEKRELERYALWLDHQLRKYETYVSQREHAVQLLEQRRNEAGTIRLLLEPFLDNVADRLALAVQEDLPFLPEERAQRLAGLRAVLDEYDAPLGEKLRRTLEALQIEAQYGSEVTAEDAIIQTTQGTMQGRSLRVGRLTEYFLSRDGQRAWMLLPRASGGEWTEIDAGAASSVAEALAMIDHDRQASLMVLPVSISNASGSVQP